MGYAQMGEVLSELFRKTHHIHGLTYGFRVQSSRLHEISMNASVVSGHTGSHSRVFSEISRQIGALSSRLSVAIDQIESTVSAVSRAMLLAISRFGECEKLGAAMALLPAESSAPIGKIHAQLRHEVLQVLDEADQSLDKIRIKETQLRQLDDRIWSVVIHLRVCAVGIEADKEVYFHSTAQSLFEMAKETQDITQALVTQRLLLSTQITQAIGSWGSQSIDIQ